MKVYIVRHGKAERESDPTRDADRILTHRGIEQARYLGAQIARSEDRPGLIITSDVTRALETARVIHSYMDCRMTTAPSLRVDEPVSGVIDLLASVVTAPNAQPVNAVMLVGHNPQVSELCEVLMRGFGASRFSFRTGEAVLLEVNRAALIGSGRLVSQLRLECVCDAASTGAEAK